jgi:uncharacterized repeat protein (TIGR04076 family)
MKPLEAEVVNVVGKCTVGHKKGDKLVLSCYDSGGLCGFFYHDIFPSLSVLQFGGSYPWSRDGSLTLECPDRKNAVTLRVRRS